MENDKFKLETRRYLAWGAVGIGMVTLSFGAVWSVLHGIMEIATLTLGMLGTTIAGVIGYYFGKKTSEE